MAFVAIDELPARCVEWLWPGRLPVGQLAIFDGDPGLGKSLVTLELCARISTGQPFADGTGGGAPAAVIVINAEDGARDVIHPRLRAAGADLARIHVLDRGPGEPFLRLPGHLADLDDAVARTGARYVVLDPITSFLDGSVNLASDQSVRAALAPLADLAARRRCAIQMVRHLNKGAGQNALYRGLYSIAFIASCRMSWLVAKSPSVCREYVMCQPKSNLDPPQPSLAYAIEPDATGAARIAWRGSSTLTERELLAGTPSRRHVRMRAEEFLLDFLKAGPRTTRDIWAAAAEHGLSERTLERASKHLRITSTRVNVCKPDQASYWVLPEQDITAAISDMPDLDQAMRESQKLFPGPGTPLD